MSKKHLVPRVSDSSIVCPFYRYQNQKYSQLVCESLIDCANLMLCFTNTDSLNTYVRTCCADNPRRCRYYRLLMEEKYPGVEELDFEKIKSELYQHDEKG